MRRVALNTRQGERGITLIEVTVAILVLAIGTVAAFRSFDAATLQIGGAPERLFAGQVALNRAAEYQALGYEAARGLPDNVNFGNREWRLEIDEAETQAGYIELRIRVHGDAGPGALLVTFVSPDPPQ